jgi:hypothetical protein
MPAILHKRSYGVGVWGLGFGVVEQYAMPEDFKIAGT